MGTTFSLEAMRVTPEGDLRPVEGNDSRAAEAGSLVFRTIDAIVDRRFDGNAKRAPFDWFYEAFDPNSGRQPSAADCVAPRRVLSGLEYIEREASRYAKGYPKEWRWAIQIEGQPRHPVNLTAFYKGRRCLFFSDDRGFWARELDPGKLEGAHHDLSLESSVMIRLEADGPSHELRVERHAFFHGFADMMARFKRVCHLAREEHHLILPWHG